jgi:1-deoxy-D-xylulose-5-phosphate synthase
MYQTHTFQEIPANRPNTPLLDQIDSPAQLRLLSPDQLSQLTFELRAYLLYSVGQSGGHFGAGLGVVELTIALHYVFNTPDDRLVWDVGHQAYPHKILTGRREALPSIRHKEGLAAFPRRSESPYDTFGVGHSSTSISAALGMAIAAKLQGHHRKSIAVIGDGALTAGMAFEAMSHAGDTRPNLLVILNDNDMAISNNVGGLNNYLARLLSSETYNNLRSTGKKALSTSPELWDLAKKTEEHVKGMMSPGTLFEELGFNYIGPIDGHDLPTIIETLENIKNLDGPQFLHVATQKGKGFGPAETDPIGFHAINKIPPVQANSAPTHKISKAPKYSTIFGHWLCDMAELDDRVVGITPAMKEGSDLVAFSERFPNRYFDVAIAEQHAVTLAAGLSCEGIKPVVAIYSTFLQRGYDQLIHDVCVQNLDVLFAIDRAGLVGEDGPTHAGSFDLSYLRCIPNMVIMAPADENELRHMLYTGYQYTGPAAVRYPRGQGLGVVVQQEMQSLIIGKALVLQVSTQLANEDKLSITNDLLSPSQTEPPQNTLPLLHKQHNAKTLIAILVFGTLLKEAELSAEALNATLVNMRFVKPLDTQLLEKIACSHDMIVTIEENVIAGGAGSAVNEYLLKSGHTLSILNLGLPDSYVEHGPANELLKDCGLDNQGITQSIIQFIKQQEKKTSSGQLQKRSKNLLS